MLCETPCRLYKRIYFSKAATIKFISLVNIIPSIIKCKIYYTLFLESGLISKGSYDYLNRQIFEASYSVYTKLIFFKKTYVKKFKYFYKIIKYLKNTIAIHYRMKDICFTKLCIDKYEVVKKINIEIKRKLVSNDSVIFISTASNKIAKLLSNGLVALQYMKNVNPVHISKINRTISSNEISKTIGDILLIASADYLILSEGSTFSFLILSIGGINAKGEIKNFTLYNQKGKIVDNSFIDMLKGNNNNLKCTTAVSVSYLYCNLVNIVTFYKIIFLSYCIKKADNVTK